MVWFLYSVKEFLPQRFRDTPFIEEDVYSAHRKLKGTSIVAALVHHQIIAFPDPPIILSKTAFDELESKGRYVRKSLQNLPTYGATFRPAMVSRVAHYFHRIGLYLHALFHHLHHRRNRMALNSRPIYCLGSIAMRSSVSTVKPRCLTLP